MARLFDLAAGETNQGGCGNLLLPDATARPATEGLVDLPTVGVEDGISRLEPALGDELTWLVKVCWRDGCCENIPCNEGLTAVKRSLPC